MQSLALMVFAASDGPNWTRFFWVIGAFAPVIAVREAIVRLIHPNHRDDDGDRGSTRPDTDEETS